MSDSPRYSVVRFSYAGRIGKTHLLDTTIPESRRAGDRSQVVCDMGDNVLWWLPREYDNDIPATLDTMDTLQDEAGDFGRAAARWPICQHCYDKAWQELLARAVADGADR